MPQSELGKVRRWQESVDETSRCEPRKDLSACTCRAMNICCGKPRKLFNLACCDWLAITDSVVAGHFHGKIGRHVGRHQESVPKLDCIWIEFNARFLSDLANKRLLVGLTLLALPARAIEKRLPAGASE